MLNHSTLSRLLYKELRNSSYNLHDDAQQEDSCKQLAAKILGAHGRSGDPERTLDNFSARWIHFREYPKFQKTKLFRIYNTESGHLLGEIKWHGSFRAYSFFPESGCVFETTCMSDITDFILLLMEEWRLNNKKEKSAVKSTDVLR